MRIALLCVVLAVSLPAATAQRPDRDTFPLDPVVLLESGEQETGRPDLLAGYGRLEYRFVTAENRDRFLAEPERWAARFGGYCARMGPLGGPGRTDLWAVHDRQLFLFASTACRSAFLERPKTMLPHDHAPHSADAAQIQRGEELRKSVLAWAGGESTWRRVQRVRSCAGEDLATPGERLGVRRSWTWGLGAGPEWSSEVEWGQQRHWLRLCGDIGTLGEGRRSWSADSAQRRAMLEERAHSYLGCIDALLDAGTFVAAADEERLGEREIVWLQVAFDRVVNHLAVDPRSGEVLALNFCGVGGPASCYGTAERRFDAGFEEVQGVLLPRGYRVFHDGVESPAAALRFRSQVEMALPAAGS